MKVFDSRKAESRFFELYDKLPFDKQKLMGQMTRELAAKKMEGDGQEFYITEKDVRAIWLSLADPTLS